MLKLNYSGNVYQYCDDSNSFAIGSYWRKTSDEDGDENAFRYFDDMYVDTTFSRVVIGDNETYTSSSF